MRLRVGIIGISDLWERRYRPALMMLADRFEIRAMYSPVALLADRAAKQWGLTAAEGFRVVVERQDIDAVLVLVSDWHGPLPALAACEAGKAVYYAADLSFDLAEAQALKERVDRSGVAFVTELPRCLAPATVRLKELIATRLGEPQLLFCHERLRHPKPRKGTAWERRLPLTTRKLVEQVDWCRYIVGHEPVSVLGVHHGPAGNVIENDYEMLSVDFSKPGQPASGPIAQISCGRYIPESWPEAISFRPPAQLQVCCERGIAFVDLPGTVIWFDEAGRHMETIEPDYSVGEQLLMHFHRAVTSLVRKTIGLENAYQALRIVMMGRESVRCGHRLELAPRP